MSPVVQVVLVVQWDLYLQLFQLFPVVQLYQEDLQDLDHLYDQAGRVDLEVLRVLVLLRYPVYREYLVLPK